MIGKKKLTPATSSSIDESIYKVDLRSGKGEFLFPPEENFDVTTDCYKLGKRMGRRSNLHILVDYAMHFTLTNCAQQS